MSESDKVLLRRYHEGGDLQAREQLIEQYMSLVRSLARRYSYRGEQLDEAAYGVARGQAAVLYDGDVVVGSGLVTSAASV